MQVLRLYRVIKLYLDFALNNKNYLAFNSQFLTFSVPSEEYLIFKLPNG